MPRKITPLITGETYHIFNRGVDRRVVFLDQEDYLRFYNSLQYFNDSEPTMSLFEGIRKPKLHHNIKKLVLIHAYCFLPNHFHLLVTQAIDNGISEFMKRVGGGYTSYFNEKYERTGSLFQGKYKRLNVESNEKLLQLSAYINYNHLIHNISDNSELYKTSRSIYEGGASVNFISPDIILAQYHSVKEYRESALPLVISIRDARNTEKNLLYIE